MADSAKRSKSKIDRRNPSGRGQSPPIHLSRGQAAALFPAAADEELPPTAIPPTAGRNFDCALLRSRRIGGVAPKMASLRLAIVVWPFNSRRASPGPCLRDAYQVRLIKARSGVDLRVPTHARKCDRNFRNLFRAPDSPADIRTDHSRPTRLIFDRRKTLPSVAR